MKKDIHPTYFPEATVACACGTEYVVGSTREAAKVAICSKCHPFFTGKQRFVDTEGRVEKFRRRYGRDAEAEAEG